MRLEKLVSAYANVVGHYGPDSEQVRRFRAAHAGNAKLLEYADAIDRVKRHLGGSGIDYPAESKGVGIYL